MWDDNNVQFARFIAEAEMAGAFTQEVVRDMCESMDLDADELTSLIERVQTIFDLQKLAFVQDTDTYEGVLLERFATTTQDLGMEGVPHVKKQIDARYQIACARISLDPTSLRVRKVWQKFVEGLSERKTA